MFRLHGPQTLSGQETSLAGVSKQIYDLEECFFYNL